MSASLTTLDQDFGALGWPGGRQFFSGDAARDDR
jgi:hypothetical protein